MPDKKFSSKVLILLILVALSNYSCKDWEYDVKKKGIHFKKIHQSKRGTHTGYMTENQEIQGFPCEKGWVHFNEDWSLESFQLSEDFMYNSTLLPAHTWIHYWVPESIGGYVCAFPYDYEVQGHLCGGSGGYKGTHTGFYDSGRLRSFFPPEDVMVDGVPCEASLLENVNLYENGKIKSCKLSDNFERNGKVYRKGTVIHFGESGHVK